MKDKSDLKQKLCVSDERARELALRLDEARSSVTEKEGKILLENKRLESEASALKQRLEEVQKDFEDLERKYFASKKANQVGARKCLTSQFFTALRRP